jgi:hypothetical protein
MILWSKRENKDKVNESKGLEIFNLAAILLWKKKKCRAEM